MIKFVLVDDDQELSSKIVRIIEKKIFKTDIDYYIEKFSSYGYSLQKVIDDCSVQKVFILDIDLGESISGLEIAKKIRKNDWDSEIIFITNHDKMFEVIYRNIFKVFAFIEKFISLEERLGECITTIINQKSDLGKFCFSNNKIDIQIYYKDITYIYRDTEDRKLIIITTNNKFLINMSIKDILKNLDSRFKQIHRACIVNTDRVNMYNWPKGYFILDTNEKVDMCSKKYKGNINE
ncbi:MAG: LytTR family transcriptional regulator DNA-binding domain-containing protein [Bacilli bacterium]|nr:LytTR family transcriptional regulator DNA-binding domain-containing protein [Bacilli bacterium]